MYSILASFLCLCLLFPLEGCASVPHTAGGEVSSSCKVEDTNVSQPQVPPAEAVSEPEPVYVPVPPVENLVECYSKERTHTVTVLMYHHLVDTEEQVRDNSMIVTAQRFGQDLDWLEENGYVTVLPRELAAGEPLPDKAVMITLDDGYASNYQLAFPLLKERGMKASIALICRLMDEEAKGYLTWDMCREMSMSGLIEFGSHTYYLHNLQDGGDGGYRKEGPNGIQRRAGECREDYEARVLTDLAKSLSCMEEELGNQVLFLAYPYGVKDSWASPYIAEHFAMTLLTCEGKADLTCGFYSLPRKTVSMERPVCDCF
ncbi:MAG: polysaccharide deacetylase family protein [Lawsonibacter sp.]|nr:polysaccharide deacetylase family protein [Lawsonibacter sp.]